MLQGLILERSRTKITQRRLPYGEYQRKTPPAFRPPIQRSSEHSCFSATNRLFQTGLACIYMSCLFSILTDFLHIFLVPQQP